MKEYNLLATSIKKLKAKRNNHQRKLKPTKPNEVWGIDMTKIMIPSFGWLYLEVVLDWHTKKIIGYQIDSMSRARQWLDALNMAVNTQFPYGIRREAKEKVKLVSDNGSQPTSETFMKEASPLVEQVFASYNNPRGNADTERVIRTIKEDLVWPREWDNVYEFKDALEKWIKDYNEDFPHSSLNYMTPAEFEAKALELEIMSKQEACSSNLFLA
jgi:transposase InsO family protein